MRTPELHRRQWMRGATAAVVGLLLPKGHAQDKPPAEVRFGFSLYGMKTLKTAEALRVCAEIGYDAVELALMPGWPTEPKALDASARAELRKQLEGAGLELVGLMENLAEPADATAHRGNLDRLKAAAELGHALAPKQPLVIETILGGRPNQWGQVKERLPARLRAWAEVASAAKIVLAVKPHVGNALHTPDDALWLVKQVGSPHLKLALDPSHFYLRGFPSEKTVPALAPETAFVHVKDARGTAEKFEFLLPGDGGFDYTAYFALLKKTGYRGPVVVEVSGQISNRAGYDPVAVAKKCYQNVTPALAKAGMRRV